MSLYIIRIMKTFVVYLQIWWMLKFFAEMRFKKALTISFWESYTLLIFKGYTKAMDKY